MLIHSLKLNSLDCTVRLAKLIASVIVPNFVITLSGDLGSGKTTLIRYILQSIGIIGSIKSPTYTLVEEYTHSHTKIYHFDLYRFASPDEWFDSGFDEYFVQNSVCFIEWAEKASGLIPVIDWQIKLNVTDEVREVEIISKSDKGDACLKQLINHAVTC